MLTPPPTLNLPRLDGALTFLITYPTVKTRLNLRRYLRAMIHAGIVDNDRLEEEAAVYFCGVLARLDSVLFSEPYPKNQLYLKPHLSYFADWIYQIKQTDWSNKEQVKARWDEFQSVHENIWKAWDSALLEADRTFSGAVPSELPETLLTAEERAEAAIPDSPLVMLEESIEPT